MRCQIAEGSGRKQKRKQASFQLEGFLLPAARSWHDEQSHDILEKLRKAFVITCKYLQAEKAKAELFFPRRKF